MLGLLLLQLGAAQSSCFVSLCSAKLCIASSATIHVCLTSCCVFPFELSLHALLKAVDAVGHPHTHPQWLRVHPPTWHAWCGQSGGCVGSSTPQSLGSVSADPMGRGAFSRQSRGCAWCCCQPLHTHDAQGCARGCTGRRVCVPGVVKTPNRCPCAHTVQCGHGMPRQGAVNGGCWSVWCF